MQALSAGNGPTAINIDTSHIFPHTAAAPRPQSTPSRKQACHECRSRKKRCDGKLPICSGCIRNKARCIYKPTRSSSATSIAHAQLLEHARAWPSSHDMPPAQSLRVAEATVANANNYAEWNLGSQNFYTQNGALGSPGIHQEQYNERDFYPQSPPLSQEQDFSSGGYVSRTQSAAPTRISPEGTPKFRFDLAVSEAVSMGPYSTADAFIQLPGAIDIRDQPGDLNTQIDHPFHGGTRTNGSRSRAEPTVSSQDVPGQASPSGLLRPPKAAEADILPSTCEIHELLEIFFERYHFYLPCIHQKTYSDRVKRGRESGQSHPLLWAMMAVAAPDHPNLRLQGLCSTWLARARSIFDKTLHSSTSITKSLQAAVWIIFQYYVDAELTEAWFFLGKTAQFANFTGVDRLDSRRRNHLITMVAQPQDPIEVEEQRKALWALFFLDRALSCLAGLSFSIDDRNFQVNFPLDDDVFQATTSGTNPPQNDLDSFTPDLAFLVGPSVMQEFSSKSSMNHIYRTSVLLGQIMTLHNQPHMSRENKNFSADFAKLDNAMGLICFALSRGPQDSPGMTSAESVRRIWLSTLVQTSKILLYHPLTSMDAADMLSLVEDAGNTCGFDRCLGAMRQILGSIKRAASKTPESLINPFLVTPYFLCCRFLCISWRDHQRQADHQDIESVLVLLDHLGERWPLLAKKFRKGIMRDLGKNADQVQRMRVGGLDAIWTSSVLRLC